MSVFLYHLDVPPFGGGFVGVDLFFVVSGYLISRIILSEADRGEFSLQRFYERRIRRLFPAAIVTIIGILAVGGLWFSPGAFQGPDSRRRGYAGIGLEFLLLARQPRLFRQLDRS
ncbi:acyltransferase [Bradyrhizobium sp. IC3123]|nr:acyltransferase [Bradyrhizobium sp. IC3123]